MGMLQLLLCARHCMKSQGVSAVCRYLVEAPPNICTPTHIARAAQAIAESAPDVMECKILEKEDCETMGMGCFLGVAECSAEPLKFVHLTYKPKGELFTKTNSVTSLLRIRHEVLPGGS